MMFGLAGTMRLRCFIGAVALFVGLASAVGDTPGQF